MFHFEKTEIRMISTIFRMFHFQTIQTVKTRMLRIFLIVKTPRMADAVDAICTTISAAMDKSSGSNVLPLKKPA
jgi:hypothetical protein